MEIYVVVNEFGAVRGVRSETEASLAQFQGWAGGHIEVTKVNLGGAEYDVVVNEEGRLNGMTRNPFFPELFGPVVVFKGAGKEMLGFSEDEASVVVDAMYRDYEGRARSLNPGKRSVSEQ